MCCLLSQKCRAMPHASCSVPLPCQTTVWQFQRGHSFPSALGPLPCPCLDESLSPFFFSHIFCAQQCEMTCI